MKQIHIKKRRFGYKDIRNFLLLGMGHYIMIAIYTLIVMSIHYAMFGIFNDFSVKNWMFIYGVIFGPLVNLIFHIWFSERGRPYLRMWMWLNTFLIFIFIALAEF